MGNLSLTQKFSICAADERGQISDIQVNRRVCLVAAALIELKNNGCVEIDERRVKVIKSIPYEIEYLKPLFTFINRENTISLRQILEVYTHSITGKEFETLKDSVSTEMSGLGLVDSGTAGVFTKNNDYVSREDSMHAIIEDIRTEFLRTNYTDVSLELATIVILMMKSEILGSYFSDSEQLAIEAKLNLISYEDTDLSKEVNEIIEFVDNLIQVRSLMTIM